MRVYIDTEFTDLLRPVLISLGLVSADGQQCYVELNEGWTVSQCSDFTREVVLPLLDGDMAAIRILEAAKRVHEWLSQLGPDIEVVSDSNIDLVFLGKLMAVVGTLPTNVTNASVITLSVDQQMRSEAAFGSGLRRHHALDDARALRLAAGG